MDAKSIYIINLYCPPISQRDDPLKSFDPQFVGLEGCLFLKNKVGNEDLETYRLCAWNVALPQECLESL